MPTRAELLADHFIRSAGIAAVYVDPDGKIGAVDNVGLFAPGDVALCCAAGDHSKVAALAAGRIGAGHTRADALAAVYAAAAEAGIGLTPIGRVVQRAFAALAIVDQTLADMQAAGRMRDFNREFAALRKANPKLRYQDHLHQRKMQMIEALAKEAR